MGFYISYASAVITIQIQTSFLHLCCPLPAWNAAFPEAYLSVLQTVTAVFTRSYH